MRRCTAVLSCAALVLALAPAGVLAGPAPAANGAVTLTHVSDITSPVGVEKYPWGVGVDKWGNVYVCSGLRNVAQAYMADGTRHSLGTTGTGDGQLSQPAAIDCDRWGNVYIAEQANRRVSMFTTGITFGRHIGSSADLASPRGVAVSNDGRVRVSDDTTSFREYDTYGTWMGLWATQGPAQGVDFDEDGYFWMAHGAATSLRPLYTNTVAGWGFDFGGRSWGGLGAADGQFNGLNDVATDGAGRVYTVEHINNRIQAFTPTGGFLGKAGTSGAGPGQFYTPRAIAVNGRDLFVADHWNNRVSRWEIDVATVATQVAGTDRYRTAVAASQRAYAKYDMYGEVVLATGENWPDALGGAALAKALRGPLLLTRKDSLPSEVASEIQRLEASRVWVLGGTGAVSDDVLDDLASVVPTSGIKRIAGANRYETAALVASATVAESGGLWYGTGIVVTGADFPDALSASPVSAANGWPIFLTEPTTLTASTRDAMLDLGCNHGYIIGGEGAVNGDVFDALDAIWFGSPVRIAGKNRYATAAALAQRAFDGMGLRFERPAIATGLSFPDALSGGALQGTDYCPLLLTSPYSLDTSTAAVLDANKDRIMEMRFIGGTGVLPSAVRTAAMSHLH